MERYESRRLIEYLLRILQSGKMNMKMLADFCDWFHDHGDVFELGCLGSEFSGLIERGRRTRHGLGEGLLPADLDFLICELVPRLSGQEKKLARAKLSTLEKNLVALQNEVQFSSCEKELLGVMARYRSSKMFENLMDHFKRSELPEDTLMAILIDEKVEKVTRIQDRKSRLVQVGILDLEEDFLSKRVNLVLPSQVLQALQKARNKSSSFREFILGEPARASLFWDDYEHLGCIRDKLAKYVKAAVRKRQKGVNILLYGPPGTGKTEFCKTLADHLAMRLYKVIESDEKGAEPSRNERISSYKLNQSLLSENRDSLVLFDEMDDLFEWSFFSLFGGGRPSGMSKVFTNRLLENNPVPTFWTINNIEWLDPAVVSRMDLAIEVKVPPSSARTRVWNRILDKNNVKLPDADIKKLARQEKIPPRIIQSAVRFAKMMDGTPDDIRLVTDGMVQAINGGRRNNKAVSREAGFVSELANTDVPLDKLMSGLVERGEDRFSLCLYGRPGTGKSAFARHLAEQLGMEVLYRRASDLFGKYVGESEKNIARMFEQAREEELFLILDEVDAVLHDRRNARQRSDVSQVTEMLTWMESHPLPFVCTTNLMENLDMASLRRFTFKVRFDYMTPQQNALAFRHFLAQDMPVPARVLNNLSPGDYAVVVNKARLLGEMNNPGRLVEMLQAEVAARNENAGSVGFLV